MFGFPVVPGGQMQVGRWPIVWQSAFVPHSPWKQTSKQSLLKHVFSMGHSSLLSQPTEIGDGVDGGEGLGADGFRGGKVAMSPMGDGNVDDGPAMGFISSCDSGNLVSAIGDKVVIVTTNGFIQPNIGSP